MIDTNEVQTACGINFIFDKVERQVHIGSRFSYHVYI